MFQTILSVSKKINPTLSQKPINYHYISKELDYIKHLLEWQSIMFRRENHHTLQSSLDNLIHNINHNKHK